MAWSFRVMKVLFHEPGSRWQQVSQPVANFLAFPRVVCPNLPKRYGFAGTRGPLLYCNACATLPAILVILA